MQLPHLCLSSLPEELIKSVAEYCDLGTRCVVTCIFSHLKSLFLGGIRLSEEAAVSLMSRLFQKRIELRRLTFSYLPEDMLRSIADFCDLKTRCAVTCINADLMPVFLGSIRLKQEASQRFLNDEVFRERILVRVALRASEIHLVVGSIWLLNDFTEEQIDIMNSVRSLRLIEAFGRQLEAGWLNRVRLIQTLTGLHLTGTKIPNVSALVGLSQLTELNLSCTQLTHVSALAGLENLTDLYLNNTQVSDVSALASLTNLTHLYLASTKIFDVSAISSLTNLTTLHLYNTQVSDVSAFASVTNLTNLNLNSTQVSEVSVLASLTNLTELNLNVTQVSDVSALASLTNLTHLNLYNTQVSDVSALAGLTNLTHLDLEDTQVSDVSALADLTNLIELWLSNTRFSDFSALAGLKKLTSLHLTETQGCNVSPLAGLTDLHIQIESEVEDQSESSEGLDWLTEYSDDVSEYSDSDL